MTKEKEALAARNKAASLGIPITVATKVSSGERCLVEGDLLVGSTCWFGKVHDQVYEIHSVFYPQGWEVVDDIR